MNNGTNVVYCLSWYANPLLAGDPEKTETETTEEMEVPGPSEFERIHGYPIDEEE